jgi:sulfopyruvate decarboxylase TPP-binding subunit
VKAAISNPAPDAAAAWPQALYAALRQADIRHMSYVPDAGHATLINLLSADPEVVTNVLTTEEEGVAIAAGAWLGGQRSVVLLQSSGVGNCINMLSLPVQARMPLLMLVTMRGEWGEFNPWQAPMGRATQGALVVTGLGSPAYDVHAAGDRDDNYYLWGAMGGAALVGLGLAQARADKHVLVITGDGEQLMAFGALATIAVAAPPNLSIIVLDNQHFGETGMQASHTGRGVALEKVAEVCGFAQTGRITTMAEVEALAAALGKTAAGPRLHVVRVAAESLPRSLPPRDAVHVKNRFRAHLGLAPC